MIADLRLIRSKYAMLILRLKIKWGVKKKRNSQHILFLGHPGVLLSCDPISAILWKRRETQLAYKPCAVSLSRGKTARLK